MAYASVSVEGGFFPSDLLDRIASGDTSMAGQRQSDFGVNGGRRLTDEIQSAFSDARSYWDAFQRRLERSRESRTTITREDWVSKFMELLGFDSPIIQRASAEVGGDRYFISHRAGDFADAPPVHIVAIDQRLDRRDGPGRRSPHALVQEYLNRSDALWGIVTNGEELRLLRDTARLSKPTYLGFDLAGMMEGNLYSEFVLLYRLLHVSRFPREVASAHECLLEQYYQQGIERAAACVTSSGAALSGLCKHWAQHYSHILGARHSAVDSKLGNWMLTATTANSFAWSTGCCSSWSPKSGG